MTLEISNVPSAAFSATRGENAVVQQNAEASASAAAPPIPVEFCVRLRVRERPQGTELFAAIASCSLLLVTYVLMRILQAGESGVHTDVVVAIIALPATLAAMAVFFVEAIERTLFVSRAGVLLTLCTAILATLNITVFAIQSTDRRPMAPKPSIAATSPGVGSTNAEDLTSPFLHWFWYGSLSLVVVLVVTSVCTVAIRFGHFRSSQRRM